MTYLVLSQQRFNPNGCHGNEIIYYGKLLYLSEDLKYFIYNGKHYDIKYTGMEQKNGIHQSNAISGKRGFVNVKFRIFKYSISNTFENVEFLIVQTNDINTYLHNKFEFTFVQYFGMRFEMIFNDISAT
uniref:Uncharacterized protein n=1 Tax=viral metagenome TaxID=1070528 RepID=A0A6C0LVP8_9ZZZZ